MPREGTAPAIVLPSIRQVQPYRVVKDVQRDRRECLIFADNVLEEVRLPPERLNRRRCLVADPALQLSKPSRQRNAGSEEREEEMQVIGHHAEGEDLRGVAMAKPEGLDDEVSQHRVGKERLSIEASETAVEGWSRLVVRELVKALRVPWESHFDNSVSVSDGRQARVGRARRARFFLPTGRNDSAPGGRAPHLSRKHARRSRPTVTKEGLVLRMWGARAARAFSCPPSATTARPAVAPHI